MAGRILKWAGGCNAHVTGLLMWVHWGRAWLTSGRAWPAEVLIRAQAAAAAAPLLTSYLAAVRVHAAVLLPLMAGERRWQRLACGWAQA